MNRLLVGFAIAFEMASLRKLVADRGHVMRKMSVIRCSLEVQHVHDQFFCTVQLAP